MTDHRSLDEFAAEMDDGGDDRVDEEVAGDRDAGGGGSDAVGDADEMSAGERVAAAEPATSTSRYEPLGAACASCDAEVVRLWVADDGAVCVDCKPW